MDKASVTRTIVLFVMLINQLLTAFGKSPLPFSEEEVNTGVSAALTVLAGLWTWWKNNSFTAEAKQADHYMHAEKKKRKKK